VVAVESVAKKARFIVETASAMGVDNVEVVTARAEEWPDGLQANDVVTARAVAALPVLAEYAAPLLRDGGLLVAWKGTPDEHELADARFAAGELGLAAPEEVRVRPFAKSERRTLYLLRKVAPTPARYPRRSGSATKRPLSANS
jgi:16S rRNA (guanine527-N7)-methyltransferase